MLTLNTKVWVNVTTLEYFPVVIGGVETDKALCDTILQTKHPELLEPLAPKMKLGTVNPDFTYGRGGQAPSARLGILFDFVKHSAGIVFRNTKNEGKKQAFPFNSDKNEFIWMYCEIEYRPLSGFDESRVDTTCHLKVTWGYSLNEVNTMIGVFLKPKPDPVSAKDIQVDMQLHVENARRLKNQQAKKEIAVKLDQLGLDTKIMPKQKMSITLRKNDRQVLLPDYFDNIEVRYDDDCKNKHNSFAITASTRCSSTCGTGVIPTLEKWIEMCEADSTVALQLKIDINSSSLTHQLENAHAIELLMRLKEMTKFHLCSSDGPMYYIENTMHHLYDNKLDYVRSCAIWPELESLDDCTHKALVERFQHVMRQFRSHIGYLEDFGFVY